MTSQYALGYKAGLEAAKSAVKKIPEYMPMINAEATLCDCYNVIYDLPVPEVERSEPCIDSVQSREWRALTDDELDEVINKMEPLSIVGDRVFSRAVIAKFKEKQL